MSLEESILLERIRQANEDVDNFGAETEEHETAAKALNNYIEQLRKIRETDAQIEIDNRKQNLAEVQAGIDNEQFEIKQKADKRRIVWETIGKLAGGVLLFVGDAALVHYVYNQEDIEGNMGDRFKLSKIKLKDKFKL